ncbi:MAG: 3-hydroxyacyl-CoA dehydrogenase NAD-binding domain-containing protein [Candidatus Kapabacteria bacterium]|nr:3-hydroxyacyl-CoA dehydrogenase NAD-binding domain-containing protein [Candidatus Kapabacteria bacterium]MCS7170437.1 3-hydroxyacyl-CoA dehydrogenase NAD-binding domain-containing protein [Candidatus Kapabacteria bacterium]MDW7997039.1 3-hydroxyacyl-CoA dehydrogenase NAD-binding domain-containing protein [Bacteroidota bacterium]MDW8224409.1 3-hydroxyacyl-CoA dehydrogenase NAD-binding domain-containing protein [Bacteroidota bacterium]
MQTVGICGAGTMGRGIALTCLQAGYRVLLYDIRLDALRAAESVVVEQLQRAEEKGRLPEPAAQVRVRLHLITTLAELIPCDIIVEAIVENRAAKQELFRALESLGVSPNTIIASNTSSISIAALASVLHHPERCVGLHFFNPAHVMRLVEVVRSARTSERTLEQTLTFVKTLGKTAVVVRDIPGFIVNRVARNYYNEALRLLVEGVATIEQIDRLMRSTGFPMGPFELMDLIGVDVNLEVTRSIYEQHFHEPRFAPSPLQQQYVDAGLLGCKVKRGFYSYDSHG